MPRLLLIFLLSLLLGACKKEKVCWNCRQTAGGNSTFVKKCDHGTGRFKDDDGNDMECIQIH